MKRLMLLIAIAQFCQSVAFSQGCPPAGIAFYAQSTIDDFQTNYPGCAQIEGSVIINGSDITNLNGISMVTSIGGYLLIKSNLVLTSLAGLEKLTSIGEFLEIYSNNALTSVQALNNLAFVGGPVYINYNNSLTSLTGLEKLTQINGNLGVAYNTALKNLSGLQNIRSIGGYLSVGSNNVLTSLVELGKVSAISGELAVYNNSSLTSLSGLDGIKAGSISNLTIKFNNKLSTCEVLSICEYLISPNGSVDIQLNASGCNSPGEVEAACQVGLENMASNHELTIYPNPSGDQFTFEFALQQQSIVKMVVVNSLGQVLETLADEILTQGIHQIFWNAGKLPSGMYACCLQIGDRSVSGRILKM
jgi:hypothetical protein